MKYRPLINITPKKGWINDPNGFIYFNNKYHLYAQHNPHNVYWGPMHWLHFESEDLIHFNELGVSLFPDQEYDKELGCFSGSSIIKDGKLYILYTAAMNNRQTQCLAISEDGHKFIKYEKNPIIDENNLPIEFVISDFRDPKVFYRNNKYYVLVAAKKKDDTGSILLYESNDLFNYKFVSEVYNSKEIDARMIECPDIVFLDEDNDDALLIFCAMHKKQEDYKYQNMFNVLYAIIEFDFINNKINFKTEVNELDLGFDFYATQTLTNDNRHYLVNWQNSWGRNFCCGVEGYNGQLGPIKEIKIKENRLHQSFVYKHNPDVYYDKIVIEKEKNLDNINGRNYLLSFEVNFEGEQIEFILQDNFNIRLSSLDNKVTVSRYNMNYEQKADLGENTYEKSFPLKENIKKTKFDILVDNNSISILINDGLYSFSSLNFNKKGEKIIFNNFNSKMIIKDLKFTEYK